MSSPCAVWPTNRSVVVHCLAALSWLLACGCSDEGHRLGGGQQTSTNSARRVEPLCEHGAELESLDRMEDGDGTIDMIAQRGGVWVSFNDETGGTQIPRTSVEVFPMSELDPPRADSHFAARSHGGGFTVWGAGIGFELYSQKAYDLSRYAGITFWARRAPDTTSALRFTVTDSATTPRGGQCHEFEDYTTCADHFGSDVTLDTEFQRYSFTWKELTQKGDWGDPRPPALNSSEVYAIHFQTDPAEAFDFWIDDVALLCQAD